MAVIGASPVTFISEDTSPTANHGKQYQVPLSQLTIDDDPVKFAGSWSGYHDLAGGDQKLLEHLLKSLRAQGLLTKPPP
jgi:hypothetical protein